MLKRQWTDGSAPSRSHRNQKPVIGAENNIPDTASAEKAGVSPQVPEPSPSAQNNAGTRYDKTSSREEICMMMANRDTIVQSGQNPFFTENAYMTSMMDYFPGQQSQTYTSS